MRLVLMLTLVSALFMGCTPHEQNIEQNVEQNSSNIVKEVKNIDTSEIVRILKNENVTFVGTSHRQDISIYLKNGSHYEGVYDYTKAGAYSDTRDVLNLVVRIKKERPELKDMRIICE
jgi:hypothetical protein